MKNVLLLVVSGLLLLNCLDTDEKREANLTNAKQLKVGMDSLEVKHIMGEPSNRDWRPGTTYFYYSLPEQPDSRNPGLEIKISTVNGKVKELGPRWVFEK